MYTVVNAEVITQLQATVGRKGELLTQVFNSFEHIEAQVAQTYMAAVSGSGAMTSTTSTTTVQHSSGGADEKETTMSSMSRFISKMGNMSKPSASTAADDSPAVSLGMEGQPEVVTTRNTLTTTAVSSGSLRPTTPPPPSYTPSPYMAAPTAAAAGRRPSSPQPAPPPPPPPPPAHRL